MGDILVRELGLEESSDTLSRWMAHHISELIVAARENPARRDECAAAILELWSHRAVMPDGHRPFEDVEPIFRLLNRLSEDERFDTAVRLGWALDQADEAAAEDNWLALAVRIDRLWPKLIRQCLVNAHSELDSKTESYAAISALLEELPDEARLFLRLHALKGDPDTAPERELNLSELQKLVHSLESLHP